MVDIRYEIRNLALKEVDEQDLFFEDRVSRLESEAKTADDRVQQAELWLKVAKTGEEDKNVLEVAQKSLSLVRSFAEDRRRELRDAQLMKQLSAQQIEVWLKWVTI